MPGLIRTAAPAAEPLTLAEAKAHLRVEHTADDALITTLITVAREAAEDYTQRAFITQTWRLWLNGLPLGREPWWDGVREAPTGLYAQRAITLPRAPLLSVVTFSTFDAADVETAVNTANYAVDAVRIPGQVVLNDGVALPATRNVNGIKIEFTCGYGAAATAVPAALRQGILHHVAALYQRRGDETLELPAAARTLYAPYRIMEIA